MPTKHTQNPTNPHPRNVRPVWCAEHGQADTDTQKREAIHDAHTHTHTHTHTDRTQHKTKKWDRTEGLQQSKLVPDLDNLAKREESEVNRQKQ